MNIYLMTFISLGLGGLLYNRYQEKHNNIDPGEVMRRVLFNETQLSKTGKPIMWIHIPFEKNARVWESFYSRTSNNLNLPYVYMTIKSIIASNANKFHICIIDDDSFERLIPEWRYKVQELSQPSQGRYRTLGMLKLLQLYGGVVVPPSFLCFKPLDNIKRMLSDNETFFTSSPSKSILSESRVFTPSLSIYGSPKGSDAIKEIIYELENSINQDKSYEFDFNGRIEIILMRVIEDYSCQEISPELLGLKTDDGQVVSCEHLLEESADILFAQSACGILIPSQEIQIRNKYSWFEYENIQNILEGNYMLSHYFRESLR
jgi:hypothetical protein